MRTVMAVVMVVGLGSASCGVRQCLKKCQDLQTLVVEDAAGNPLTPLQVTDGSPHRCDPADDVFCEGNTFTYPVSDLEKRTIHVEATTGEVFSGEIDPEYERTQQPGECCGSKLKPITLKLTSP